MTSPRRPRQTPGTHLPPPEKRARIDDRFPPAFLGPRTCAAAVDDARARGDRRAFEPFDLRPLLARAGRRTVLVQSACLDTDTDADARPTLRRARRIAAVIAWVVSGRPATAAARLGSAGGAAGAARGSPSDPRRARSSLDPAGPRAREPRPPRGPRARARAALRLPAASRRSPELARSFPHLTIVIDHLGKPPLRTEPCRTGPALSRRRRPSERGGQALGGEYDARDPRWTAVDLRPAVDVALQPSGPTGSSAAVTGRSRWSTAITRVLARDGRRVGELAGPRPRATGRHRGPNLQARGGRGRPPPTPREASRRAH